MLSDLLIFSLCRKYIKQEKTIRENISRMTSKSMLKIQAEMTALRQILGTVSNGVQRNAVAVEKLKKETVQVSFHSTII